jgi:hypothetical protein
MLTEEVRVQVGAGESKISGVYTFRLEEYQFGTGFWKESPDSRVRIYVPVPLPSGKSADHSARHRPVVRLRGRQIPGVEKTTLPYGERMEFVKLPKGWFMQFYLFEIPARSLGKRFEITVDYVQPHFSGDIVGYVPFDPPREPGASRIRFEAGEGRTLEKAGGISLFSKRMDVLEVKPENRKLIKMRSVEEGS